MYRLSRTLAAAAIFAAVLFMNTARSYAQPTLPPAEPAPAPTDAATQPATAPTTQRTTSDIMKDWEATGQELSKSVTPQMMYSGKLRQEQAPVIVPLARKMLELAAELEASEPRFAEQRKQLDMQLYLLLSLFDEQDAIAALQEKSNSEDPQLATSAKTTLLLADWIRAIGNAESQNKIVDRLAEMIKANPESEDFPSLARMMSSETAANDAIRDRLEKMVLEDMKGPAAEHFAEQIRADQKLRESVNQPVTIKGKKIDGTEFSTEELKGKVILVDFWATWCGPCIAELPKLKETYKKYREQGFEVVGVSCDSDVDQLKNFLAIEPEMTWPQLFEPNTQLHPEAERFGIKAIPAVFIIDKKGVLRSVKGRTDAEELIPKLLAEAAE